MMRAMLAALILGGTPISSQQPDTVPRTPQDSMLQRARRLFEAGNATDGRRLVDSVLKITTPEKPAYAEALYWRAATASAAVDAERDYRRLLVEAPLSARAEDAMLQLAQLEQARGDRRAASAHLQRFLLSYPNNPARPRVAVSLVRLLFDQGQIARGCEALRTGREVVPQTSLELRNQLEFYAPRCVVLEAAPAPSPPPAAAGGDAARTPARSPAPDTTRSTAPSAPQPPPSDTAPRRPRPVTAPPSTAKAAGSSFYSVQVAAYDSPETASQMATSLVDRGLEARVDGKARPYRVRVGRYATRAEAVKAAATLKGQGITGFVTLVSP